MANLYSQINQPVEQFMAKSPILGRGGALGLGAAQGLANVWRNIGNVLGEYQTKQLANILPMMPRTEAIIASQYKPGMQAVEQQPTAFARESELGKMYPKYERAGEFFGPIITPLGPSIGTSRAAEMLGPLARPIAAAAERAPSFLGSAIERASQAIPQSLIQGGYYGGLLSRPGGSKEERLHNMGWGALNTAGINSLLMGIPGSAELFIKNFAKFANEKANLDIPEASKYVKPEEAAMIADSLKDQPIPIGDLVNSPKLQSFYHNVLRIFPLTGVSKRDADLVNNVDKQATDFNNSLLNGIENPPNFTSQQHDYSIRRAIADQIKNTSKANYDRLNQAYNNLFSSADAQNIEFKPELSRNFAESALSKHLETQNLDNAQLLNLSRVLQVPKAKLNKFGALPVKIGEQDVYDKLPPEVQTDLRNDYLDKLSKSPSQYEMIDTIRKAINKQYFKSTGEKRNFYENLSNAYNGDIENSLQTQGKQALLDQHNALKSDYKENVVPYLHQEPISNILHDNIDYNSPALENALVDSTNEKVLNDLSPENRERLLRLELNTKIPDNGEMAAPRVLDAVKKLSEYERRKLITPDIQDNLNNLARINKVATPAREAAKSNFWRNISRINHSMYYAGLPTLHVLGPHLGAYGAIGAGMAYPYMAATGTIMPAIAKALRSPALARAYIRQRLPLSGLAGFLSPFVSRYAAQMGQLGQ